jgi:nucleotide-binding universal stress UspA family protein
VPEPTAPAELDPFARVACGIDGSPESLDAARQAVRLAPPGTPILLLGVRDRPLVEAIGAGAGTMMPPLPDHRAETVERLERAAAALADAARIETRLLDEPVIPSLLHALHETRATLVALGSHGHSRGAGVLLGSVTTALLHDAPCSVLVARTPPDPERFPRSITVGFDGSPQARAALSVAGSIARRLGTPLRALVAGDAGQHDLALPDLAASTFESVADDHDPVHALTHTDADLIVLGSRGLRGVRSLGSVSERVAHRADGSVLVIRPPGDRPGLPG